MKIVGAALLVCVLARVAAADEPKEVTLDEALALLAASPRITALRGDVDVSRAEIVAAGVVPNPTLSYVATPFLAGTPTSGQFQQQLSLDVPILAWGIRPARRAAADRQVSSARARVRAAYVDAARELRHQFVAVLAAQERVRLLGDALADIESVQHVVEARQAAGTKSQYDVARIHLEVAGVKNQLAAAEAERQGAAAELGKLVGRPGWQPVAKGAFAPAGVEASAAWTDVEARLPAVVAAREDEGAAASQIVVARRERWPIPVVTVGAITTNEPSGFSIVAGLSWPLPLFDRNQGELARKRAALHRSQLEREAVAADAHADLARAIAALQARREALAAFEKDAMAHLPELRQMADDAYKNGQGGVLDLLDTRRSIAESVLTHVDLVAGTMNAEIDVLAASGAADSDFLP